MSSAIMSKIILSIANLYFTLCLALPFNKDAKIDIIRAGPAGIHMASCLDTAGYDHITMYEKTSRIGGKAYSFLDPDDPEVFHEMGTCYTHTAYDAVFDLLRTYVNENLDEKLIEYSSDNYYQGNK
ncbi:hypothetical protein SARC_10776 [Sphaeroforma arctica JP610]|uniref:Amine oxidase domain-containing protein n=1 Tax=Sphaeroforma arctica JP610 TaxID=667725 RepID=A0A0L0FL50_9EUKA|nr:hypothetical protein SARC_10776 [Sphaeroforma arctica JP610]KNC76738.1 hypothetical protein SARC_10776 [Sphaeroforma arctica JP610]|eukprot:XP_014150640.1 hypothetical protein SARC_10776 [Sphaeroforma arctica JP610]